jgi:aspartate racemase
LSGIVGIIGGMGPQATVDLMNKVISMTPADEEADHVHMIVDCNPTVPSRTRALLEGGKSPGPELALMARRLAAAGAELLAMPCNTAHAFLADIRAATDRPVLDMIDLAVDEVSAFGGTSKKVGLLATRGTRDSRLYHERIERRGWTVLDLDESEQQRLDVLTKDAKTRPIGTVERAAMAEIIEGLEVRGADVVVAGCTEVPLLLPEASPVTVIDPTLVLAREIVARCKGAVPRAC